MTDLYKLSLHLKADPSVPHDLCYGTLEELKAFVASETVVDWVNLTVHRFPEEFWQFRKGGPLENYRYPSYNGYVKIDSIEYFKANFAVDHTEETNFEEVRPLSRRYNWSPKPPEPETIPWYQYFLWWITGGL